MADVNPGELAIGSTFHGRYQIVRRIKAGGMGAVYEVVHLETRRRRALKVMLPSIVADPALRARFQAEATVAADVHSEHVVEIFDAGVDPETGTPFLVMELLDGEELAVVLRRRGRLLPREAIALLGQTALALDRIHAAGIVHRDLKPENLFLTRRDDGSTRLKVLDFGIAKVLAAETSAGTQALGTPLYMPPEQMRGQRTLGPASDNYALAHIAFRILAGASYWDQEKSAVDNHLALMLVISEGLPEPASVRAARLGVRLPPAFDAWFAAATAKDPALRPQRASEMVAALAAALGEDPPASFPSTPASDTLSIGALVGALYASISAADRSSSRLANLFAPQATLARATAKGLTVMTFAQFVEQIGAYLSTYEYHEQELARRVERFGHIAHVWSTCESTYTVRGGRALSATRGVNSLQLFFDRERWWITSMLWDTEESEPLPAAYLEGTGAAAMAQRPAGG